MKWSKVKFSLWLALGIALMVPVFNFIEAHFPIIHAVLKLLGLSYVAWVMVMHLYEIWMSES